MDSVFSIKRFYSAISLTCIQAVKAASLVSFVEELVSHPSQGFGWPSPVSNEEKRALHRDLFRIFASCTPGYITDMPTHLFQTFSAAASAAMLLDDVLWVSASLSMAALG